jgi:hypothetical protein
LSLSVIAQVGRAEPQQRRTDHERGYLKKLMENEAVRSYVARHASEIFEQFKLVLNTVSMEEAVEQAEREDGPSGAESVARTHPKQDDSSAASDPGMDGQLG